MLSPSMIGSNLSIYKDTGEYIVLKQTQVLLLQEAMFIQLSVCVRENLLCKEVQWQGLK